MAKKKQKKRTPPMGRAYHILVGISAVIVLAFCGWKLLVPPPKVPAPPVPTPPIAGGAELPNAPAALQRKDLTYTFLLAASDQVSGNSDTIMVATYDVKNQKVGLASLPRDTLVSRKIGKHSYHKLNAAYALGGVEELKAAVSDLLGIPIDFYITVDVKSFVKIVDAAGGIDFEVPVYMNYDAPDQDLHIHYEPRLYRDLTGQQVLEIARCRKNSDGKGTYPNNIYDAYPDADIGRSRTQQALMKAVAKKLVSWGSIPKITHFVEILNQSVKTDLTLDNMLYFATSALQVDLETGLSSGTFAGDGTVTYKGSKWCYQYDKPAALEMINNLLNPYTTAVTEDMTHILQA
ncbi:MAG: LCP family protein, partial [Pseudoflavonifractor sp.]